MVIDIEGHSIKLKPEESGFREPNLKLTQHAVKNVLIMF